MIAVIPQAAAEYVDVMISNGMRAVSGAVQDAVRWSGDHLWVIGIVLVALVLLRKVIPSRRSF